MRYSNLSFRIFLGFICFCFSNNTHSQCYTSAQFSLGNVGSDIAYDIVDAGNNEAFIVGTTNSYGAGGFDILVTKLNSARETIWSRTFGAGKDESIRKANKTLDGGLILIGQTKSSSNASGDILCLKINSNGSLAWSKKMGVGSTYGDLGMDIIQTIDGGYALVGILNVYGNIADLVITRLDQNANILWSKRFDSDQGEDGVGLIQKEDTLVVTGDLDNKVSNYSGCIMSLKLSDGTFIKAKKFKPGTRGLFNPYIFKGNSDGYWINGHIIDGDSYAKMQPVIMKLDVNFNITKTYAIIVPGIFTNNFFTGFAPMKDGFLTCASSQANPTGYLFYVKENDIITLSKKFSGNNERTLNRLAHLNNKIMAVGRDNSSNLDDFFITEFGEDGSIDSKCHPDTALVTVDNPDFTTSTFTWPTISNVSFTNVQDNIISSEIVLSQTILCDECNTEVAFTAPDTVCVNTPVKIVNQSVGGSNFYWNFDVADINTIPEAVNLGNVGNALQIPVFTDVVSDNGKYYVFVTNNYPGKLIRLNFGNSLLNAPIVNDLGNFGGIIPGNTEGIQVVNDKGKWYAIIVGGSPLSGTLPTIIKIDFGNNLENPAPVATNWGNIGNLNYPVDLHVFKENNNWYGFTLNANNNTFTRFNFGTGFDQTPTAVNLGNIGNLSYPTGIYAIKDNGNWHVFITNEGANNSNPSITRLDFGNSLLNTPIAVNLGNPGNALHRPRDVYIMKFCGQITGFIVNGEQGYDGIVQLDFQNNLLNIPRAASLGNLGNLDFPHSISKLFRVGADLYSFITNARNNTITRIRFAGSNNASIPNSSLRDPTIISYSQPGTYNINLMVDEGLPTQASFCKAVVVLPPPKKAPTIDTAFCAGDSVLLNANFTTGINLWNTGSSNNSITVKTPGIYWVQTNIYGCSERDSVIVSKNELPVVELGKDTAICNGDSLKLDAGNIGSKFLWQNGSTQQTLLAKTTQLYFVRVTDVNKCINKDSLKLIVNALPVFQLTNDTTICKGKNIQLAATGSNISFYNWIFNPTLSNPSIFNPVASPKNSTKYFISVTDKNGCVGNDSVLINVAELPIVKTIADTAICIGSSITLATTGSGGYTYQWSPANNLSTSLIQNPVASPVSNTQYTVTAKDSWGCTSKTSVNINLKPLPVISAYGDTAICSLSSVQLLATSPGNVVFNWTPSNYLNNSSIANPTASPLQTTTYKVTVTGNNNCSANDSVLVQVFSQPVFSINPTVSKICSGDSAILTASGGDEYQWTPAATVLTPSFASSKVFPVTDTRYSVLITDNKCGVSEILEAVVTILPKAEISITKTNDINCVLGQAMLSASGGVQYQWEPEASLSTPKLSTTIASPAVTTTYYLKATSSNGCVSKDSIQLTVQKGPDENNYLLPTAFSPNNDGMNDCFGVKKWGYLTNLEFSIFNRFGERVFFTTDASNCWDGRYKGIPQDAGAFVYIVKANGICGSFNKRGTFVLIR